ncbi:MAG: ATP-binding protein [Solirubrobacteraceae bacterium]
MSLQLELPRELDSAAAARHAVDGLAGTLPDDQLGDVRLLVSELVTNALRHAEMSPQEAIVLRVRVEQARVHVEVSDPGQGFELDGRAEDRDTVEGWGLYLVATLADRWGIDRDAGDTANSVWFELDR